MFRRVRFLKLFLERLCSKWHLLSHYSSDQHLKNPCSLVSSLQSSNQTCDWTYNPGILHRLDQDHASRTKFPDTSPANHVTGIMSDDHFWTTLDHFWTNFVPVWDHFGSIWTNFVTIGDQFRTSFGPQWTTLDTLVHNSPIICNKFQFSPKKPISTTLSKTKMKIIWRYGTYMHVVHKNLFFGSRVI